MKTTVLSLMLLIVLAVPLLAEDAPIAVRIETVSNVFAGDLHELNLMLDRYDTSIVAPMSGFRFLLAYDADSMFVTSVRAGDLIETCGWEYFTYLFNDSGSCTTDCPSGLLSVKAIAGTAPTCQLTELPVSLASLKVGIVPYDRVYCEYKSLLFFWTDCTDNVIYPTDGQETYVSDDVYHDIWDFENPVTDGAVGFPTSLGMQDDCPVGDGIVRQADFEHGGVELICPDWPQNTGDINVNGFPYETADAVMYKLYFEFGLTVFGTHISESVYLWDINGDGIGGSVADLVLMIKIIEGDADPIRIFNKYASVGTVAYSYEDGLVRLSDSAGAAFLRFKGDVSPSLLADNMTMQYFCTGGETRVLVLPPEGTSETFSGDFIQAEGDLLEIQISTADGHHVTPKLVPSAFVLEQNYPNPFNPTTSISYRIDKPCDVSLEVFNTAGQRVTVLAHGYRDVGVYDTTWDGSGYSSGVYLYRLTAGEYTVTKKMMLVK